MQGALGIAMSQAVDYDKGDDVKWDCVKAHGASVLQTLWADARIAPTYFNVNFPVCPPEQVTGVRVVPHQRFAHSPFAYYPSRNKGKFFIAIPKTPEPLDPASDFHVLHHERAITVTPLSLAQSDMAAAPDLEARFADRFVPAR